MLHFMNSLNCKYLTESFVVYKNSNGKMFQVYEQYISNNKKKKNKILL